MKAPCDMTVEIYPSNEWNAVVKAIKRAAKPWRVWIFMAVFFALLSFAACWRLVYDLQSAEDKIDALEGRVINLEHEPPYRIEVRECVEPWSDGDYSPLDGGQ